jgi:hypothetical protein
MKNTSKQRTNWLRQERNSKGHFMPYKKDYREKFEGEFIEESAVIEPKSWDYMKALSAEHVNFYTLEQIQHAFLSGLKANNSFYPPSKLWEFYKRDMGIE